jgi:hypothetical protein
MTAQLLYTLDIDASGAVSLAEAANAGQVPPGLTHLISLSIDGQEYLLGADPNGNATLFPLLSAEPFIFHGIPISLNVGRFDMVRAFTLANQAYLITYAAGSGDLYFFSLDADGTVSKPYHYYRKRQPGLTTGWSTFETFTYLNSPYFLAYNDSTGDVDLFGISAKSVSAGGIPPLLCSNVWSWTWAKGWGNFAFFQLGGENFFFKINRPYPNINIDHLSTDPASRSNEVGTHLEMPDWQEIGIVRALTPDEGTPFLLTYQADGKVAFHRIYADCQGWRDQAPISIATGVSQIVTYRLGSQSFVLFY